MGGRLHVLGGVAPGPHRTEESRPTAAGPDRGMTADTGGPHADVYFSDRGGSGAELRSPAAIIHPR